MNFIIYGLNVLYIALFAYVFRHILMSEMYSKIAFKYAHRNNSLELDYVTLQPIGGFNIFFF